MLLEKRGTVDQKMQFEIAKGYFRLHALTIQHFALTTCSSRSINSTLDLSLEIVLWKVEEHL